MTRIQSLSFGRCAINMPQKISMPIQHGTNKNNNHPHLNRTVCNYEQNKEAQKHFATSRNIWNKMCSDCMPRSTHIYINPLPNLDLLLTFGHECGTHKSFSTDQSVSSCTVRASKMCCPVGW